MVKLIEFSVPCVAEIDNHIGSASAHIKAHSPDYWYIDSITNKWGSHLDGEFVCSGLYEEIEAEVNDYFAKRETVNG